MSSEQQDDEETRVLRDVLAQECEALAGLEQSAGNALADVSEVHARLAADGNALRDGIQAELAAARQAAADREAAAEATAPSASALDTASSERQSTTLPASRLNVFPITFLLSVIFMNCTLCGLTILVASMERPVTAACASRSKHERSAWPTHSTHP